ncbi:hypothetical protein [Thalassospira sp. A3_1]|uniref:hypothetical protein n=1 Tax=Thalassospira sp. A3_1 TaxID=2821088 RepID=UPI001AD9FBE7|nr:hypothetical protein [Thalassospira sp. A3_1]MBO9506691.1 hypothetical protein [Thalassospira sp. A3_1]
MTHSKWTRHVMAIAISVGIAAPVAIPATAFADPPSWAPAHGHRAKQHHKNYDRGYRSDMFVSDGNFLRCNRDVIGALIGGGAGTAIGSTIGKGSGRDAAMIGGAILGLLGGYSVGQSLDQADAACTGYALQQIPDGQTARWINPESQREFDMTPTRTWQNTAGRYCREYTATTVIGGKQQQSYGTACMQPDGSWQIVS